MYSFLFKRAVQHSPLLVSRRRSVVRKPLHVPFPALDCGAEYDHDVSASVSEFSTVIVRMIEWSPMMLCCDSASRYI